MPYTCCCVPGCKNRGGHQFPSDPERKKLWVIAIRRIENKSGKLWTPSDYSVVCRQHLKEDDYIAQTVTGMCFCY